jgi:hypothetical protein
MSKQFIVVKELNSMLVQTRSSTLSEVVAKAERLVQIEGYYPRLYVMEEFDNSEAKKLDWSQSSYTRKLIYTID